MSDPLSPREELILIRAGAWRMLLPLRFVDPFDRHARPVRMKPRLDTLGAGTVDKGLGVGGTARVAWPLSLPSNFDLTDPWTACLVGGFTPPPGFPPLPEPVPLKTLQLAGRPSIEIRLLDLE